MSKLSLRLMMFLILIALAALTVSAQDFQRTYNLGPGGSVSIHNISGDVIVTGYDGQAIIVTGIKTGRDRDRVNFDDRTSGNSVDVRVDYPDRCEDCRVDVRFEVKVPRNISYKFNSFSSVSGNVNVTGVTGELTAKSVSGDTTVNNVNGTVNATSVSGEVHVGKVEGTVSAKSTSGDVEVEIISLEGAGSMEFASVSGDVSVKLPGNLDAEVKLSSMSGRLKTDFPLEIEESKYGTGRKAAGRLGSGSRNLKISTVSGDVSLLRM
ncbi:MAG: DUF4097 family beta strand repeat protein [Acidobacteria bacterium]|nr:DUF4097 family beta strand repeat protein [Acidobacteriota bacterium]